MNKGVNNDYNVMALDNRFVFRMVGDVETMSGSYNSIFSANFFEFFGTFLLFFKKVC